MSAGEAPVMIDKRPEAERTAAEKRLQEAIQEQLRLGRIVAPLHKQQSKELGDALKIQTQQEKHDTDLAVQSAQAQSELDKGSAEVIKAEAESKKADNDLRARIIESSDKRDIELAKTGIAPSPADRLTDVSSSFGPQSLGTSAPPPGNGIGGSDPRLGLSPETQELRGQLMQMFREQQEPSLGNVGLLRKVLGGAGNLIGLPFGESFGTDLLGQPASLNRRIQTGLAIAQVFNPIEQEIISQRNMNFRQFMDINHKQRMKELGLFEASKKAENSDDFRIALAQGNRVMVELSQNAEGFQPVEDPSTGQATTSGMMTAFNSWFAARQLTQQNVQQSDERVQALLTQMRQGVKGAIKQQGIDPSVALANADAAIQQMLVREAGHDPKASLTGDGFAGGAADRSLQQLATVDVKQSLQAFKETIQDVIKEAEREKLIDSLLESGLKIAGRLPPLAKPLFGEPKPFGERGADKFFQKALGLSLQQVRSMPLEDIYTKARIEK